MKWPETLTLVRHDTSAYNVLREVKDASPIYQEFRRRYEADPSSAETLAMINDVRAEISLGVGDHNTPLAPGAGHQAEKMAGKLKDKVGLPDIVFVSPYLRTKQTLERMVVGWPELGEVETYEEDRIIEQDHGLQADYNDWRVFYAKFPEQKEHKDSRGPYWYRYPQGESVADVRERLRSWLATLTREFAEKKVLAVTHHLAILALRANLERWDADRFIEQDQTDKPINAGITIYRGIPDIGRDGKGQMKLEKYNEKLY